MRMRMVIFLLLPVEYGTKRISIITKGIEMIIVSFGQMTACLLLPMTITTHFMKLHKEEA